jgi:hypothetical protein
MGISLTKVFEDVLLRCTFANINSWAVLTRKIWLRRNFVVFGGVFIPSNQLVQESQVLLEDVRRTNAPVEIESDIPIVLFATLVLWKAPPPGLYKTNWDATIVIKNAHIGVCIIARDS